MDKPLILLTGSSAVAKTGFPALSLNRNYADCVAAAGGVPLLAANQDCLEDYVEIADGLLLPGGADIAPCRYHAVEQTGTLRCDLLRDEFEFPLIKAFLDRKKPVLGICRGFQLLNVALGGTLIQDIPEWCGATHSGGVSHLVTCTKEGILRSLFGESLLVNSYHHQAVGTENLAKGLRPNAFWQGNSAAIIEGFEHEVLPVLAVQWHPERMVKTEKERVPAFSQDMAPLFTWLVQKALKGSRG